MKLLQSDGFQTASDALAYARRTAINLAFDYRRRQRHRAVPIDPHVLTQIVDAVPAQDRTALRETLDEVMDALGELSEHDRYVLTLRHLEQRDYGEVGELTGRSAHQARAVCHRALQRLRRRLERRGVRASAMEVLHGE